MTTDAHTQLLTAREGQASAQPLDGSDAQAAPHGTYTAPPQSGQHPAEQRPTPGPNSYGFAVASFVLGIASIVSGWTLISPIVGVVLGAIALRRNTAERTLALWGVWLNVAILAFALIGIVVLIGLASLGLLGGALAAFSA